ncbi:hypothetical protein COB57_00710 [Candidatus Peregrinibacteria bacterium]|nr:MAG: hypothetical protein COB57_00710 [Candidatus Peregrinibacteria bacterium]
MLKPSQISKIKGSLIIKDPLKKDIINNWDFLSLPQQKQILLLLEMSDEIESDLIRASLRKNENFFSEMSEFISHKKRKSIEEKEGKSQSDESIEMEKLINNC